MRSQHIIRQGSFQLSTRRLASTMRTQKSPQECLLRLGSWCYSLEWMNFLSASLCISYMKYCICQTFYFREIRWSVISRNTRVQVPCLVAKIWFQSASPDPTKKQQTLTCLSKRPGSDPWFLFRKIYSRIFVGTIKPNWNDCGLFQKQSVLH